MSSNPDLQAILNYVNERDSQGGIMVAIERVKKHESVESGKCYIVEALDLLTSKYVRIGFEEYSVRKLGAGKVIQRIDHAISLLQGMKDKSIEDVEMAEKHRFQN